MNSLKKLEEEKRKKEEFEQIIEEEKKRIEGWRREEEEKRRFKKGKRIFEEESERRRKSEKDFYLQINGIRKEEESERRKDSSKAKKIEKSYKYANKTLEESLEKEENKKRLFFKERLELFEPKGNEIKKQLNIFSSNNNGNFHDSKIIINKNSNIDIEKKKTENNLLDLKIKNLKIKLKEMEIIYIEKLKENFKLKNELEEIMKKPNIKEKNLSNKNALNFFGTEGDDFNIIQIKIKNDENKDINKAIINFIKKFKTNIKEKYKNDGIKIKIDNVKDFSFIIYYEITPPPFDFSDIEFLDEQFEKKIKNVQKFEIKVEFIEGKNNLISSKKIHQYYLIFNRVFIEKEDFYEHLKVLKKIAINLLLKK